MARHSDDETGRASLPPDVQRALFQLDERVHAWNEADEAHDHATRERLTEEVDKLAETLFMAVLRQFGSEAVREHFGDDAPRFDCQPDIAWTGKRPTPPWVIFETSGPDDEGFLVFVKGRLVAVLVRVD